MKTIEVNFDLPKLRKWDGNYTAIRTEVDGKHIIKFCDYYVTDEGEVVPYTDKVFVEVIGEYKAPSDAWGDKGGNHFLVEKINFPIECENPYELFEDVYIELEYYEKHKNDLIAKDEYWENMRKYSCMNIYFYANYKKMIDTKGYFWYNPREKEENDIAYCHFVLKSLRDKYSNNQYYDFGTSLEFS